ncbi:MAG: secondary thiamine-phosphate synthase enzyme YjbQ [Bacillota bacterium]
MLKEMTVSTNKKVEFIDITQKLREAVRKNNIESGSVSIFIPHTTAAVTINENADPDVQQDIIKKVNEIIPFKDNYKHIEGNSAAHIKASIFGNSELVIIENNDLVLGRWQGIYFCEFDGPRRRKYYLKFQQDK